MKVSVCIPSYNQEKTIFYSIQSAMRQKYTDLEVLVIDDVSCDKTADVVKELSSLAFLRLLENETNLGIGGNLTKCMREAKGEYIIYLCGDDVFANPFVVGDMVDIFESCPKVGVIGRTYYQFIDGYPGAVNRVDSDYLLSSCNPSGIGYRKSAMEGEFTNRIFVENISMVKRIVDSGWQHREMDYDTVAVRLHSTNTCLISSYYKEPPVVSVNSVIPGYINYPSFISMKNRCPSLLHGEIYHTIRIHPWCVFNPGFWFYFLASVFVPGWILIRLCNFYRHRIERKFCRIKYRQGGLYGNS